jgi:hypothetical protein
VELVVEAGRAAGDEGDGAQREDGEGEAEVGGEEAEEEAVADPAGDGAGARRIRPTTGLVAGGGRLGPRAGAGDGGYRTTTLPTMAGWITQANAYVPGRVNVRLKVSPAA